MTGRHYGRIIFDMGAVGNIKFPGRELLKTFEHSKIIASHNLDLIMDVCHRCIVIREGAIVADGPVSEILTNRKLLEENHLELPLSLQRR